MTEVFIFFGVIFGAHVLSRWIVAMQFGPRPAKPRRTYYEGPAYGPVLSTTTPPPRERCRCGQCEQCDPLYQSYGR